jgi:GNAT superfamily N-acetyltransferase
MAILELHAPDRARVAPLFADLSFHLAVAAVLADQAAGTVYADSATAPQSALLLAGHRVYLAGDPGNDAFLAAARPVLERRFASSTFVLYYVHPDWPSAAQAVLTSHPEDLREYRRSYFLQSHSHVAPSAVDPPEGFRLAPVTADLLADPNLANLDPLLDEMCSERASVPDFLSRGFGTALLHDRAVAGWCLSEYNLGHRCEVGIAVDEPFRRRGLATLLGRAFAAQAQTAAISEIGWHCWAENAASCATARALGFTLVRTYPAHVVRLPAAPARP